MEQVVVVESENGFLAFHGLKGRRRRRIREFNLCCHLCA